MQDTDRLGSDAVIERALQGYAPENARQAAVLVSGWQSVLPLDDAQADAVNEAEPASRID